MAEFLEGHTKKGIDAKVTGDSFFYKTEDNGKNFYPTLLSTGSTDRTGSGSNPTVSLGTNGPNYDDIAPSLQISGVGITPYAAAGLSPWIPPNTEIRINVQAASTFTTHEVRVTLWGFYDEN